jgi:hypothetical protein
MLSSPVKTHDHIQPQSKDNVETYINDNSHCIVALNDKRNDQAEDEDENLRVPMGESKEFGHPEKRALQWGKCLRLRTSFVVI